VARFYRLVRLVIDLVVLRGRRDRSKDAEMVVLRHQLAVPRRNRAAENSSGPVTCAFAKEAAMP
jgi:hypothetical protein